MSAAAATFRAYLVFDFQGDHEAAGRARAQIEQWTRAFKLQGQILTRERREGSSSQVVVRLEFEDFERLAFERWLERIPREAAFASAGHEILRPGEEGFIEAEEWFGATGSAFR